MARLIAAILSAMLALPGCATTRTKDDIGQTAGAGEASSVIACGGE